MSTIREVGSSAWYATYDTKEEWLACPDCAGTKHLRVLLPDETMLRIPCAGCALGYDPPTGTVKVYKRQPRARLVVIEGLEIADGKTSYHTRGSWRIPEAEVFDTEPEALTAANKKAADADAEERSRVLEKERPTRTWAWHVHYHRNCIKRAEQEIERHTAKLGIARAKAKELSA